MIDIVSKFRPARILDVGCSDGLTFEELLKKTRSTEAYAVDINEDLVKEARSKGIMAYVVDVDVDSLPFGNDFFDCVVASEVIEHLLDPDHLLDEVFRVLIKGGLFALSTPNLAAWYNRIALLGGIQPFHTEVSLRYNVGKVFSDINLISGHIRAFTPRALLELSRLHGFTVRILGVSDFDSLPFPVNVIDRIFSKRATLASHTIAILTKT